MDANPGGKWGCRKRPVRGLYPNRWGLFDLHGNVWELCADPWVKHLGVYDPGRAFEEVSPKAKRTIRGGAFNMDPIDCRSARRIPGRFYKKFVGFRVVLEARAD